MYVPPVTKISCGKFWYVVAEIVLAVKPLVNIVSPVTVPPDNGKKGVAGKFWYVVAEIVVAVKLCNDVSPVTIKLPSIPDKGR